MGTLANLALQIGGASESQGGCVLRTEEGGTETAGRGAEDRKGGRQDQGSIGRIRLLGVAFHNTDCGERGTVCWGQGRLALVLEAVSLIASGSSQTFATFQVSQKVFQDFEALSMEAIVVNVAS